MQREQMRTWAEISLDNLEHNYRALRGCLEPGCRFVGVVKADAYGHGAVPVARKLEELGADYLAVACLEEALELRRAGIQMPVLILGVTPPEFAAELVEHLGRFDWKAIARRLPALLLPAVGTLVYLALNWSVTGNPFAFTVMQQHWYQGFCPIADTLWYVLNNALSCPTVMVRYQVWIPTILLFSVCFALLVWARKRFRSMYTLYGFVYLVLNYSLSWLLSAGRYLSCALPFFLFAAALTRGRPRWTAVIAAAMGAGFLLNLTWFLTGGQVM